MSNNIINYQMNTVDTINATILSGAGISESISLSGTTLVGLIRPASVTGGFINFSVSRDGTNFYDLEDTQGNLISVALSSASRATRLFPTDFYPWRFVKIKTDQNQVANITFTLIPAPL